MALRAAALLVLSILPVCSPGPVRRPVGWFEQCLSSTNLSITALEVLPGGGWDNLRNIDMGRVMNFNYAQCQTTEDGLYFVPDDVFVIARKVTNVETYAEVISSWLKHKSSTAYSINIDASGNSEEFGELNGKFSADNQRVRTNQNNGKSTTTRVQIRNHIYTAMANPDFTLDSHFVQQVEDIADAIEKNQTRLATYLSEKVVADYGTHVITSVDAGANLVKEDYIKSSDHSSTDDSITSIKASAGYNFFSLFTFDAEMSYKHDSSDQSKYDSSITSSFVEGHGGAPYYPGMCLVKWQESTRNNLVGIDRSGLPLYYVINTNTLPDLPEPIVSKVSDSLQQAIKRYYTVNTHPGCVKINSPNFNFQANVDDDSCEGTATDLSFGGVFRTCLGASQLCQNLVQTNPKAEVAVPSSCDAPYRAILLNTEYSQEHFFSRECKQEPYVCWVFYTCHREVCSDVFHARSATVYNYWCYSDASTENKGYLFGGLYSSTIHNPITKRKSCPQHFNPVKFLSNDVMICLSNEYTLGAQQAVPFGGFFSCDSTNPLSKGHSHCPPQFSQHLFTIVDSCPIHYCVKSVLFRVKQLLPIRLPPFTRPPVKNLQSNGGSVRVLTEGKQSWVKVGQSKSWTRAATDHVLDVIKNSATDSTDVSWEKAGVGLGLIALVILIIVGVVLTVRWKKGLPLCKKHSHREDAYSQAKMPGAEKQVEHEMEQPC